MVNSKSILLSIKKMLGIEPSNKDFDPELIIHINGSIAYLDSIGVNGNHTKPYTISGEDETWDDFDPDLVDDAKQLIYLRTRLLFDPPNVGSVQNSFQEAIKELTWRINVRREDKEWINPDPST